MPQRIIEDFYSHLCDRAKRLDRLGEKPTVLLAVLKYIVEERKTGISLLNLLGPEHINRIEFYFLELAKGRLKSPKDSWRMVIEKDRMNMRTTVEEYIALTGQDVSKAFTGLSVKSAELLLKKHTSFEDVGISKLRKLFHEMQKPRKELNGKSYEEDRKDNFERRFFRSRQLIDKEHLPHLSIDEAEYIFVNVTTGNLEQNVRNLSVNRFIANGIQKIRTHLHKLLYGTEVLKNRFDEAISSLRYVSTDFASTLLQLIDPTRYPIWNSPVEKGLEMIGCPLTKVRNESVGRQYERLTGIVDDIAEGLNLKRLDIVDSLLYLISDGKLKLHDSPHIKQKPKNGQRVKPPVKGGIPEKIRVQASAYKRNESVVKGVKDAEYWTCQVCGQSIITPMGMYYCEAHHIQPLSEGGDDDESNVLCLCPNHHAEMHNGLFYIEPHSKRIVYHDKNHEYHGVILSESRNPEAEFHHIGAKYLRHHKDHRFGQK